MAAHCFRTKLEELLKDKTEAARKASIGKDGYDCPNWSHKQADNVGYQRAIEEILKYL